MATAISKKGYELDVRVENIIKRAYSDYEKYLQTPQDIALFRRKCEQYWDTIHAELTELATDNGNAE